MARQKLFLEYHYHFGHTHMPLVQQILRSEAFPVGKFSAAIPSVKYLNVQFVNLQTQIEDPPKDISKLLYSFKGWTFKSQ